MRKALILLLALALQGCAHLTTYQEDIGTPTTGVAFDAKQRLLLVNKLPADASAPTDGDKKEQRIRMCTEPSPDALSALGASLGASILSKSGGSESLAGALGETSASIGLRTTSIQLMRDAMYRACEAYLSGGIDSKTYADLQAHSQTLIVGLLAIEQLTGAVKAQQVSLTSHGSAALEDVSAETQALISANNSAAKEQSKLNDLNTAKAAAEKTLAASQAAQAAGKADATTPAATQTKLDAAVADATTADGKAADDVKTQTTAVGLANDAVKVAQQALDSAKGRVSAAISGSANFDSSTSRNNISDSTASTLAGAVTSIVSSVVGQSIESRTCLTTLSSSDFSKLPAGQQQAVIDLCNVVRDGEAQKLKQTQQLLKIQ